MSQDTGLHGRKTQLLQLIQHKMHQKQNMQKEPGLEYRQQQHMGPSVRALAMAEGQGSHGQRLQAPMGHVSQALGANAPHGTGALVHAQNTFPFTASNASVLRNGGGNVMKKMGWSGLEPQVTMLEQMQMMRRNQKETSPSQQHMQQQVSPVRRLVGSFLGRLNPGVERETQLLQRCLLLSLSNQRSLIPVNF